MNVNGMIKGLHHVTATVNDAQEDYDFYTKILGLRLVKETVNFDNEKVYHFYYANEEGSPSTVFTTFPYKGQEIRDGVIGTGQVTQTAFSVPLGSIEFWKNRLDQFKIAFEEQTLFGRLVLTFKDPSGLGLQIVGFEGDKREPIWLTEGISRSEAIRGLAYVILLVVDVSEIRSFIEVFGYEHKAEENGLQWLEIGAGGVGNSVILKPAAGEPRGLNGIGTVHHVAHRVESVADLEQIRAYVVAAGRKVTEIKDRKYFKSIYFRVPGGVLFEIATTAPGFTVDEDLASLGTALKLPDWQEPNRERIEANLLKYER